MSTANVIGKRLASKSLIANVTQSYKLYGVIDVIGDRGPGAYIDQTSHVDNGTCNQNSQANCNCCGDNGPPYYDCNTCNVYFYNNFQSVPSSSFNSFSGSGYVDAATKKGFKSFAVAGYYSGGYGSVSEWVTCDQNCNSYSSQGWIFGTSAQVYNPYILGQGAYAGIKEADSSLWTWGWSYYGQRGNGVTGEFVDTSPTQLGSFSWNMVAGGYYSFSAVRYDGLLFGWGYNGAGELGDNTTTTQYSPVQIGTDTWKYVARGNQVAAGIKSDNTLWLWGNNGNGQLGDNTTVSRSSPVQIAGGGLWKFVTCGNVASYGIKTDGTMWAWGYNGYPYALGDGTSTSRSSPVQIGSSYSDWTHIVRCDYNNGRVYAIRANGTLWAWGYTPFGLANSVYSLPTQVGSATNHASGSYGTYLYYPFISGGSFAPFITTDKKLIGYGSYNDTQTTLYNGGNAVAVTADYRADGSTTSNTFIQKYVT